MPRKPTRSTLAREVTPTPVSPPCRCGNIMGCDECWAELCRTQGYSSPADGLDVLVQIHVDITDDTHDALAAVAAKKRVRVGDVAREVLTAWASTNCQDGSR